MSAQALRFGTAGLRGLRGTGPNAINPAVITRVTAVVADLLRAEVSDAATRGVVVGYDARHGSKELAEATAQTIAGAGIAVHWLNGYTPTPVIAYATRVLEAAAGIVLTASHNPPEYLGYKLYWSDAVQIIPPLDTRISEALAYLPEDVAIPRLGSDVAHWHHHDQSLRRQYLTAIARPLAPASPALSVAYSAMHGVAGEWIVEALAAQSQADAPIQLASLAEQYEPDGDFPTVTFPNPEEPGALDALVAHAQTTRADLALATDPDGDRLGVALPDGNGQWRVLMGDELGVLLADYLLSQHSKADNAKHFVLNTVVSSRLLARIAAHYGAGFEQTLTGFKWLWHRALQREAQGERLVLAYEDAIGYCPTRQVYDKDGIATAVVVVEMAQASAREGKTLYERLQDVYARFGLAVNRQLSIPFTGEGASARMDARVKALRENPPAKLAGLAVTRLHDYVSSQSYDSDGSRIEPIALPTTNLLQIEAGPVRVSIRPSGTEPKLKIYLDYIGKPDHADQIAEAEQADQLLTLIGESLRQG